MQRLLISVAASAVLMSSVASTTLAADEWCSGDPPVHAVVNGEHVTANVIIYVQKADRDLLHTATASGTVQGNTLNIEVHGPNTPFKVVAVIRSEGISAGSSTTVYPAGSTVSLSLSGIQ